MNAWIELLESEYNAVWDRFESQFAFRPSVKENDWPAIQEPTPSITYRISNIFHQGERHYKSLNSSLMDSFLKCFKSLTNEDDWIYALDWQHPGYKFWPHRRFSLDDYGEWKVPILPNGDYYIFLEREFEFGVFGHPWEQTMCVFGERLLSLLNENKPLLFSEVVRKNGRTPSEDE
jgi:hypothetical protein